MHRKKFGETSRVFSVNCIDIMPWSDMNALWWLAEDDININKDITDIIPTDGECIIYKITANVPEGEEDGRWIVNLS